MLTYHMFCKTLFRTVTVKSNNELVQIKVTMHADSINACRFNCLIKYSATPK